MFLACSLEFVTFIIETHLSKNENLSVQAHLSHENNLKIVQVGRLDLTKLLDNECHHPPGNFKVKRPSRRLMQALLGQLLDVPSSGEVGLPLGNREPECILASCSSSIWFDLLKGLRALVAGNTESHVDYCLELERHDNIELAARVLACLEKPGAATTMTS